MDRSSTTFDKPKQLNDIHRRKVSLVGPLIRSNGISKHFLMGTAFVKETRGRQKARLFYIRTILGVSMTQAFHEAQDRVRWRGFIRDGTADQPNGLPASR